MTCTAVTAISLAILVAAAETNRSNHRLHRSDEFGSKSAAQRRETRPTVARGRCSIMTATGRLASAGLPSKPVCYRWAGRYAAVGVLREEGPQEQGSPPGD